MSTLLIIAGFLLTFGSLWMVFEKAGIAGWVALVPVLNILGGLRLVGRSYLWILLFLPFAPFALCILSMMVARRFGRGLLFGLGMFVFPWIFLPILAFGEARYLAPARS